MADCDPPVLVANPKTATREEHAIERGEVAKYAACNRDKFHGLRDFWRGLQ